ncbi:Protein GCY-22 a, partial [Aphelenchoides avenae]
MQQFNWDEFAFFYTARRNALIPRCALIQSSFDLIPVRTEVNITLVYKRNASNDSYTALKAALLNAKSRARVIVACLESREDKRNFMLAAAEVGMTSDEYTYVYMENTREGFGTIPFWVDQSGQPDGKDEVAKRACEKLIVMDAQQANASSASLQNLVLYNMHQWPFYCEDCPTTGNASLFASALADAFYIYAMALNRSIEQVGETAVRNGTMIAENSAGTYTGIHPLHASIYEFWVGYTGIININKGGTRRPVYFVWALNASRQQQMFAAISTDNAT